MPRSRKEDFRPKLYTPQKEFVGHMRKFLHLLREDKGSVDAGAEVNKVRRMKNYYVNNLIFPAMANLTFFFEAISKYPELREEFESEIKDLLGIKRINPKAGNYAFMFESLIAGIISMDVVSDPDGENDFRLRLIDILQGLIFSTLQPVRILETMSSTYRVFEDIKNAKAWTEMLAFRVPDEYDFKKQLGRYDGQTLKKLEDEAERKKYIEGQDSEAKKEFEKHTKEKLPIRTFSINTKKLLE